MASDSHSNDDDDVPGANPMKVAGTKRGFGDIDDDEDVISGSKKANVKAEETAPGVTTETDLSVRESLQSCKDTLATCQSELEAAKSEVKKWHSAFHKESFIPSGSSAEPRIIVSYIQKLKSSEESLREQLEKAKKKEAEFKATIAKREQEILNSKGKDSKNNNVTVNLTTTTKATSRKTVWDNSTHMIFLELCLDEVRKGNKPRSHFNKAGWANLGKNLKDRTGKSYSKLQLKNHWDSMKRDWKLYDRLMRSESGQLGWDPVRKTIDATSEWWDQKIQADPDLLKFKDRNLEMYQMYYDPLFRDFDAIENMAIIPHIQNDDDPNTPQLQIDNGPDDVQDENGVADIEEKGDSDKVNLGNDEENLFTESSSTKKNETRNITPNYSNKGKTKMTSSFEVKLDTVLQALSSRSTQTFPRLNLKPSIAECMDIVSGFPGFVPSSKCYNKALRIFCKKEAREAFMYPPNTEGKIAFLKSLMEE